MLLCLILLAVCFLNTVSSQILDDKDMIEDKDIIEVDEPPPPNQVPVPFGHIFIDGIDDPSSGYMRPIDLLELRMRYPRTEEEENYMLRHRRNYMIRILPVAGPGTGYKPRITDVMEKKAKEKNDTNASVETKQVIEFDKIHKENVEGVLPKPQIKKNLRTMFPETGLDGIRKEPYFSHNVFEIPGFKEARLGWTTCEEFEKDLGPNSVVHPKDIVDIDWEPFYIWTTRRNLHSIVNRFSYPTKKQVEEYKKTYERFLPTPLDWEQPKLLLKERIEMLLIAGDRKGLFYGIQKHHISLSMRHKNITLPTLNIRLKIVDPYLALMYCNEFYATIMGTSETVPKTKEEKIEEAKLLKFKGQGYPVSRKRHLEKSSMKAQEMQKILKEEKAILRALPGYPGIDDVDDGS